MLNKKTYELTNPQKSIWLIQQFYPKSTINNIAGALRINVKTDFEKLAKAFNLFIKNNASFRLKITINDNTFKQYLDEYTNISIPICEIQEDELNSQEEQFAKIPFDVMEKELYNVKILKMPNDEAVLLLNLHHLISDAWTMVISLNEIYSNYIDLLNGKKDEDFEENPSYIEFINEQSEYIGSKAFQKDKVFWEEKFTNLPDYISFKTNETSNIVSNRMEFLLEESLVKKINNICSKYKISAYIFFLSIFTIYFRNIFNSNFFTIGNPVLNRSNYKQKHTTGMFISTEPFIVNVNDSNTFLEHAQFMQKEQSSMYRHLKYPYDSIFEYVKNTHHTNNKLFDIVFSYQNAKTNIVQKDVPISSRWIQNFNQIESLMIHLKDTENSGNLTVCYDYLVECLTDSQIEEIHNRILNMIYQAIENIEIPLKDIEIVSKSEQNKLLNELNNTELVYDKKSNLVEKFEEIVKKYPNNIAVCCDNKKISYCELNARANALAKRILDTKIDTDIIAFEMKRSIDMIIAIWAILKSNHTYMPIDPEYPEERKKIMLENSKTKIIITQEGLKNNINYDCKKIFINEEKITENINIKISPSKKAYIMYTSGSTGIPKAVSIRHENVLNFVKSMQERLDYEPREDNKVLSVTTVCFDIFVFEHFTTLLSGLELVIATELEAKTPKLLNDVIVNNKITKILTTPSRIQLLFLNDEYLTCLQVLKEIILGGEPFPKHLLRQLNNLTKARIFNLYGPTETTVYSTFKELTGEEEVTIGLPIGNTQIYLWSENNKLVPFGAIGEIIIGGDGVGDGYYKNEEITQKSFVKNPYKENDIVYKTGDFGQFNDNGELICLGRKDYQVKIRGYRIELDDICNHILNYPSIEKAVVIDRQDSRGKKYLCAYFVSSEKIDILSLKKYLTQKLPNYMIPTYFVKLEELPLTINHKVNRKALPEPVEEIKSEIKEIEPKTETQKILCEVIAKALKLEKIGICHDLFDFGIDSLDIINIQVNLLPYEFKLNTQDFYEYRTIEELSKKIEENTKANFEISEANLKTINSCMNQQEEILEKTNYHCILLTGCTGFLGMQILYDILNEHQDTKVICLTRSKSHKTAYERINELCQFYFNKNFDYSRIEIIDTDITKPQLGLLQDDYKRLSKEVDLVINCAANVRYYGEYSYFKKVNVDITQNLINFCKESNILFAHVSTLGISGNYLVSHKDTNNNKFDENSFYIGQRYNENVYIRTKFEAEKRIYDNVLQNLNAVIFRVGNLTGRYKDGKFQKNIEENAFYNILLLILKYSMIPESMLNQYLEFTPVDLCSKAMINLLWHTNKAKRVYHIFNQNYIRTDELVHLLNNEGFNIKVKNSKDFNSEIMNKVKENSNMLKGMVNDLDSENGLSFNLSIDQRNENTNKYLKDLNFEWPKIEQEYIHKIIKHIKNEII